MGRIGGPDSRGHVARVGNVLFGADVLVSQWVAEKIPGCNPTAGAKALGVMKDGNIVAGIIYDDWNGVHLTAAIAAVPGSQWADRRTLHALFFYPFVTLDCEAISVAVPASNLPSLNLATKLGFVPEAIIQFAAHDGSSLIVLKQFRKNCRWVRDDGEKRRRNTIGTGSSGNGGSGSPVQPA